MSRFCCPVRRISVLVGCLLVASGQTGAQTATETMMDALLRPQGWRADWTGPGSRGITEVRFERTGKSVVAMIHLISPFDMTCENPVTVAADRVTFDGCRDPAVTLVYQASNGEVPFQGRSPRGYEWKLRPK